MRKVILLLATVMAAVLFMADESCPGEKTTPQQSTSGVKQASVKIAVGSDGLTAEQRNVSQRLTEDNKPGAIKHLYVISPYSGQVILYSTVRGKVTSGGKRLTPTSVASGCAYQEGCWGAEVNLPSGGHHTPEVIQDDGTYGQSGDYLYWWDVRGIYHQHYLTGGQIITISDQPLPIKSIIINMEKVEEK